MIAFMGPFVDPSHLWFGFCREGEDVDRVEGEFAEVLNWIENSPVTERWMYDAARSKYVRI